MMTTDWRKDLSFSDRLSATSKMQPTRPPIQIARPLKPRNMPKPPRKRHESMPHRWKRDYHEQCQNAAEGLLNLVVTETENTRLQGDHVPLPETDHCIGRYTNAQHFKNGLFSEIFKATLPDVYSRDGQARIFALKITTPSMMRPPHDSEREARILAAAKSDQVIPLLETFKQTGGRFVLACPYMPYDLELLLDRKQLTHRSRCNILKDVFLGLAHLHQLGIIHRDVKPSNILLSSPTGPACIADFGIAWVAADPGSEPKDGKILDVGTTCYRPPELLFGNSMYNTSLDLWAAGCVAAQVVCLNGRTLFDAGDLGSELALIKSIFETLGTPDLEVWPEAASFPDWGKMNFRKYPGMPWSSILPDAEPSAVDFVSSLVVFESERRLTAAQAIKHPHLV